jgi:hypothetical protein
MSGLKGDVNSSGKGFHDRIGIKSSLFRVHDLDGRDHKKICTVKKELASLHL